MRTAEVNGQRIDYDVTGEGPALLLLTGWCQDHRLFDPVVPELAGRHRVIRADWRGHGAQRTVDADFGVAEQADDVIALLDHLGVDSVVPVSTSHGGWANIEVADRLGVGRVPRVVVIDWIMVEAGEDFVRDLRAIQDPERWVAGRRSLFDLWLGDSGNAVVARHLDEEMAAFDFDMWARSCRVIEGAYGAWGSPLKRMAAIAGRPVMHLFSQPTFPGYREAQREFAASHPWFEPVHLDGRTHFPTLESPAATAERIAGFVR